MKGNIEIVSIFLMIICCGITYGIPLVGAAFPPYGITDAAAVPIAKYVTERPTSNGLLRILSDEVPPEPESSTESSKGGLENSTIANFVRSLLEKLFSLVPYVAKIVPPIVKTVVTVVKFFFAPLVPHVVELIKPIGEYLLKTIWSVLKKVVNFVLDYIRNMPPEKMKNIEEMIVKLVKNLLEMKVMKSIIPLILRAVIPLPV